MGLCFVPFPGLSSSGDQVFGEHGRYNLSPPPSLLLGFLGIQPAHLLRRMLTVQNPKRSWFATKPACSLVDNASLGPRLPPSGSGCPRLPVTRGGWAGLQPGCSAGNCLRPALGFMHLPDLSCSGSGTQVVLRGTDSVGPVFCALPRSEQLR